MAVPATVDDFIDLVRKSGVADEKRLDACLGKMRTDMPADAPKAAGVLVHHGVITNFQAENILAGKWRRFSIGKYKVLERLGTGGFAQVYLCEHKLMRRRVAVKVLPVAKTKNSSALERFHREARAAAQLDHPNIVHAYDIDQDEDLHFLVMEYIDGANLQELVKKSGPLSVERACHYIRYSAHALQHAFEHGLVHRDIKPGNILVDRSGVVKLLDLGLALSFAEADDQLTKKHDDGTLGTADYLSPEQAMDSHDVDIRTDIYSLGVTFYFLLAGRAPFEGMPIAQKLLAHSMKQPKPVTEYRKDVPADVLAILDKMMAKKVDQRYATPGDVADALAPFTEREIAPPTDAEMPKLCAAATGQAPGDSDTTVGKNDTPVAAPRPQPSSDAGRKVTPAPASSGAGKARTPPPSATAAAAPVHSADAPLEPFAVTSGATVDASPRAERETARSRKTPIASQSNPLVFGVLILAFVVVPIVLVGAIGGVVWWFYSPPQVEKAGPPKLEVSRDPTRKKAYPSIQQAIKEAQLGSVIELWDDSYEENIVVEQRADQRTSITLQAAPGKEIVWRSKRNDPKDPIVRITKGQDFKLKGKGITFDGEIDKKRNVNDLIMITGDSPGLVVDEAQFKNFARSAVFAINAAGTSGQPIKLHRLVINIADKKGAGIYFDANKSMLATPVNANIEIDDCDFRGHDPAKTIQFRPESKDEPVFGENVRWPGR